MRSGHSSGLQQLHLRRYSASFARQPGLAPQSGRAVQVPNQFVVVLAQAEPFDQPPFSELSDPMPAPSPSPEFSPSSVPSLEGVPAGGRVVVAMSGGVDSSVVAALLKGQGYDVVGITLQLYDHGAASGRKGACCAGQDIHDARRVADTLGFPHYVLDYEARFRTSVMETFADSYLAGETPIPCIACNQTVKFRDLLGMARQLGAAALATGHYAELRQTPDGPGLYRAADPERDQSYFLFATPREELAFLRFPLGAMPKAAVRRLAAGLHLPVADKPDSQDICFVPSGRYTDIIERLRPGAAEPGDIVHLDGRVLGRHPGIIHFTVGQRRGLGVAAAEPLFVVRLDATAKKVVVGPREALRAVTILLKNPAWLGHEPLDRVVARQERVFARIRSTHIPQPATLCANNGTIVVTLGEGEYGVSAGQACVLYADGTPRARVLGGGWIASTSAVAALTPSSFINQDPLVDAGDATTVAG